MSEAESSRSEGRRGRVPRNVNYKSEVVKDLEDIKQRLRQFAAAHVWDRMIAALKAPKFLDMRRTFITKKLNEFIFG